MLSLKSMTQDLWSPRSIFWLVPALLFCVALSAIFFTDRLLSTSVDMAHHAQLIEALENWWLLPSEAAGYMREMYEYPNFAHRIASLLTKYGTGFLSAMLIIAVASVAFGWLVLFYLVTNISLRAFFAVFICAITIALFSHAMLGGEIVKNFFYAQAVGEGMLIGCTVVGASLVINRKQAAFLLFSVTSVYIACQTHLLPGLKLFIALTICQALSIVRDYFISKRVNVVSLVSIIALPITFISHPQVTYMTKLVDTPGGIDFGFPITRSVIFACTFLLCLSSGLVLLIKLVKIAKHHNLDDNINSTKLLSSVKSPASITSLDILAILGIAAAAPALLQLLLQIFKGTGSDYSVAKHFFGVMTFLVVIIPTIIIFNIERLRAKPESKSPSAVWRISLPYLAAAVLVFVIFYRPSAVNVEYADAVTNAIEVARHERSIDVARDSSVFASSKLPSIVSYITTQSVLRHRRDQNSLSILASGRPDDLSQETYVFTPVHDQTYDVPACRIGEPIKPTAGSPIVQVSASCLHRLRSGPKVLKIDGTLAFKAGEGTSKYLIEGWSTPENRGVWSSAKKAIVDVPVHEIPLEGDYEIEVSTVGFVNPKSPSRTASLLVNGQPSSTFQYQLENASHIFRHKLAAHELTSGKLLLEFNIPDAVAPISLGLNGDTRELGVGLLSVKLTVARAK